MLNNVSSSIKHMLVGAIKLAVAASCCDCCVVTCILKHSCSSDALSVSRDRQGGQRNLLGLHASIIVGSVIFAAGPFALAVVYVFTK